MRGRDQNKPMFPEKLALETTNCLFCGAAEAKLFHRVYDYYTKQPGRFTLVRCMSCNLVYLDPRPTASTIGVYYPSSYRAYVPMQLENLSWPKRWLAMYGLWKRCRPLLKIQTSGKVLDVGCGAGHFLAAMNKSGWQGIGVDFSAEGIKFARNTLQVDTYVGRAEAISFQDGVFDAVTMWDTLEHLPDPRAGLLEIRRVLKPNGHLLLRVPSLDSLDARLFGPYWAGLDAPRHMTIFSKERLTALLQETGFVVERLWCMSGSYASFVISMRFFLEQQKRVNRLRNLLLYLIDSPLGALLSASYFFIIDKLVLGPEITVLARKRLA